MENRSLRFSLVIFAAVLSGCTVAPKKAEPPPQRQYWPALPERPRFVHEITLRGSADITVLTEKQALKNFLTGNKPDEGQRLHKPLAIAAQAGRIYVTDTKIKRVHVLDLPRRKHFILGHRFEGELTEPRGVALDGSGNVYVVDARKKTSRIVVSDPLGLFIKEIPMGADVTRPTGIAVSKDGQRIYLVDTGGIDSGDHRVLVFNAGGVLISTIGTRGHGDGQFNLPVDAAVADDGSLYVLDAGNFRVQVFKQGKFVRSWGKAGRSLGDLARPRSISIGAEGNVYIGDASFANVQIFNPEGELLLPLGRRGVNGDDGLLTLVVSEVT